MTNIINRLYLGSRISSGAVALNTNRIIQQIADGLVGLFVAVFLLEQYGSLSLVLLFYIALWMLHLFLVAPGAMAATSIGFKKAIQVSIFGGIGALASLFFFESDPLLFSVLLLLFGTLYRVLYWIPYHTGLAKFILNTERGRTIAVFQVIALIFAAAVPFIGGLIIGSYGFPVLFFVAAFIFSTSIIPLFFVPSIDEQYRFGYFETWRVLFHPRDRRILLSYMADGAQAVVGVVIWPIFIWLLLDGNYEAVGALGSLVVIATIVLQLFAGRLTDSIDRKTLLRYGSVLFAVGWMAKAFVQTAFQIFIVSTYHNFSNIFMRTPFDALMYEQAADAGHYMDEYTVLRSMALALGRICMLALLLMLLGTFSVHYAFIIAALVVLFVNLL